ncbi:MAG: 30S ribosomal protein S9 [Candidatus Paceibacterota bacterium]|jgi:small subunit ribosomal protein S9
MEKETKHKYIEAVGRRKTAIARVRAVPAPKNSFSINGGKNIESYFKTENQRQIAMESLLKSKVDGSFAITAMIAGGGIQAQAEALRLGIARILIEVNPELRKGLKKEGFLKRDQRAKERRKFGLKKARKSPQWSKR